MIKYYLIFLLFGSLSFAQLYERKNIEVIRANDRTLLFNYKGDLSNDTLQFVVKATRSITSPRLVQKISTNESQLKVNYYAGVSLIEVYLQAEDTEDRDTTRHWYDITRVNNGDTSTLFLGWFDIWSNVATRFDGTNLASDGTRFYVAGAFIDTTVADGSFFVWDSTNQTINKISKDSLASLLGVGDVDLSNVVDKTTPQTITGSKEFTADTYFGNNNEIKFDSDSSKLKFTDSNFVFVSLDNSPDNSPNFNFGTWNQADGNGGSTNRTLVVGYNVGPNGARLDVTKASFAWEIESNYLAGGEWAFEPHWTWFDNNGNQRKPISLNLGKADGHTMGDFNFDKIRFKSANNNADYITIYNDQIHGNGKRMIFHDSIPINLSINNYDYLTQANTVGAFVPMIKVDSDNKIRIDASSVGTVFGNSTYRYAYLSSSYQRFQGPLYLTDAGYNYSTHADTALSFKITSPGYGIISSKYLYNVGTEFHWSNASYASKMIFQYSTGNLTLGSVGTVGTGAIYAGSYYTGSTQGYLSSSPGALTASGLYVAESSGGSPTRQLYYRTITINGVTIQVLTTDTP